MFASFSEGLKKVATTARDFEAEEFLMTKLAKIMRQEILEWDSFQFSGNFPHKCQENSVPTILHTFMSMLLNGPHVQDQDKQNSQSSLMLLQLVCFNSKFRGKRSSTENTYHFKGRETP